MGSPYPRAFKKAEPPPCQAAEQTNVSGRRRSSSASSPRVWSFRVVPHFYSVAIMSNFIPCMALYQSSPSVFSPAQPFPSSQAYLWAQEILGLLDFFFSFSTVLSAASSSPPSPVHRTSHCFAFCLHIFM